MNDKNDLFLQMEFMNKILPLYGIESVCDTYTEVNSKNLSNFDEMTKCIPEIKKLFKTSVMNLGRSQYKITPTNAIPILKHICVQANVPYNINKYSTHYTFSLAEQNKLLTKLREANTKRVLKAKPFSVKPYEFFENLSFTEKNKYVITGNKEICLDKEGDLLNDTLELFNDFDHIFKHLTTNNESVRFTGVYVDIVRTWYENRGQKFLSIPLTYFADIYHRVKSVKLYNKEGMCIHDTNKVDISEDCFYVPDNRKNLTDINIPMWCMNYLNLGMRIPYTCEDPEYYKIELECIFLTEKNRLFSCNWGDKKPNAWIDIDIDFHKRAREDIEEVNVKWRLSSCFTVPYYSNVIRNIRSSEDICISFNDIVASHTSHNSDLVPVSPYTSTVFNVPIRREITEVVFEYDYSDKTEFVFNNHTFVNDCGYIYLKSKQ